jgi:hypothetical protein
MITATRCGQSGPHRVMGNRLLGGPLGYGEMLMTSRRSLRAVQSPPKSTPRMVRAPVFALGATSRHARLPFRAESLAVAAEDLIDVGTAAENQPITQVTYPSSRYAATT